MAVVVKWSDEAMETFEKNIQFLILHWTEKEIVNFVKATVEKIKIIEMNPRIYKRSEKHPTIRKCSINRRISLYFKYFPNKKEVILLTFWNNRQNPQKLKY